MERYLIEDYNVLEDESYLKDEGDIESYFNDSREMFECGQEYYTNHINKIIKIKDKFYSVDVYAEIESEKQEYGDRLYFVDKISSVEYEEIPKPIPKGKISIVYNLLLANDQKCKLEQFFKENHITYEYKTI